MTRCEQGLSVASIVCLAVSCSLSGSHSDQRDGMPAHAGVRQWQWSSGIDNWIAVRRDQRIESGPSWHEAQLWVWSLHAVSPGDIHLYTLEEVRGFLTASRQAAPWEAGARVHGFKWPCVRTECLSLICIKDFDLISFRLVPWRPGGFAVV